MTALAYQLPAEPELDYFDGEQPVGYHRPDLRLITGTGPAATTVVTLAHEPTAEVYRRRRFFALLGVTAVVVVIALASGVSLVSFGAATTPANDPVGAAIPAVHVVLPGDSYAAIAADLGIPNPVAAGEQLRAANGGSELIVGQRLVVDVAALTQTVSVGT